MDLKVNTFYPFTFRKLFTLVEQEKLKVEPVEPEERNILRNVQVKHKIGTLYNSPYLWSSDDDDTNPIHELRLNDNPHHAKGTLILSGHIDDKHPNFEFQLREKFPEGSSSTGARGGKRRKKGTRRRKNKSKNFSMKRWL